jgi:hypothetical protein
MQSVDQEDRPDDYDSPWKDAIEQYFPEFMEFYFPAAYAEIDWTQEHVFLDQELRAVVQDGELGKRFVDKLVSVSLLNGDQNCVYIHVEVQGTPQAEFAERMFVYNYRLYDRYRQPIASMAVLADEQAQWKPNAYAFTVLGCEHSLKFPIVKLTDFHDKVEELLTNDNAFAVITAAHILTQQTKKQYQARFQAKLRLIRLLYQRNWHKQRIINLFLVVDWILKLPAVLEQQIWHEIETIEEGEKMRYISSVERIGIEKGIVQGRLEGEAKLLKKLLERRFGNLPAWASDKLSGAAEQDLESWAEAVLTAANLEAIFEKGAAH